LNELVREGADRRCWLLFGVSIDHVEMITYFLQHLGISAAAYHSKMPEEESDKIYADFAAGRIRAIVSMNKMTTGVDIPEIDLIGMLRLTRSPGLWVQMLGRGTRPCPGKKDCLVLDFAGNTERLGPINDPILPPKRHKGGKGAKGKAPVKVCPACLVYNPAGVRFCEHCGHEFERFIQLSDEASTKELIRHAPEPPQTLHVDHVTYQRHKKKGKPDSLQVTYFCGLTRVREFICPQHGGYASEKAYHWWRRRTPMPFPDTFEGMIELLNHLPAPTQVVADMNGRYPEVMEVIF
jgi:DNA repair protein RadD